MYTLIQGVGYSFALRNYSLNIWWAIWTKQTHSTIKILPVKDIPLYQKIAHKIQELRLLEM